MSRVKDVLDVWYDSGSASLAVPGANTNLFKGVWPIDRIDEGQDQIRGWFYTLLVLGVALFGESPYKAVSMHGWVVDEKGEKMSKSKGNFVTGKEALDDLGADILRFYILWEASPSDIIRFSPARAKKEIGKMFFIWKNLHSYLLKSGGKSEASELLVEDKWIISKFNSLVKGFLQDIESYNPHHATRRIFTFLVEDLSRKYMKIAKERVREDDLTPLSVMGKIHESLLKLVAPISPFFAETLYHEISKSESIFFEKYPAPDESKIDIRLEEEFDGAFGIIEAILSFRDAKGIGLKYPLRKASVSGKKLGAFEDLIKSLANVKEIGKCSGDEVEAGDLKICIDSAQGPDEINEGYMREVSRRVRELRKKKGLQPRDTIKVFVWGDEKLVNAVKSFRKEFLFRTGSEEIFFREGGDLRESWDIKKMKLGAGI
jgi:isoleucyl-tRNA synthetase